MGLRTRLLRLERSHGARAGRCPHCPPPSTVCCRDPNFYSSENSLSIGENASGGGPALPTPCSRCGRPADVTIVRLVRHADFYGNADRLARLKSGT